MPYLLGFIPRHSLVAICLRRKQIALTMRVDLGVEGAAVEADGEVNLELISRVLLARAKAERADAVVLIVFDAPPPLRSSRPGAVLARELITIAEGARLEVKEALGVREGRYWSYLCRRRSCCPPAGHPVPLSGTAAHSRIAAAFVVEGRAPLSSREELEASIALVEGDARGELDAAYATALERPAAYPLERWEGAVRRQAAARRRRPGRDLTTLESVRLIVSLGDVLVRDELLSWAAQGDASLVALLRSLAPLALPPYDVEVLSALAFVAYCRGDGSLAAVSLERAMASDPLHPLSLLLGDALESGIRPEQLAEVATELVAEFSGSGGSGMSRDER